MTAHRVNGALTARQCGDHGRWAAGAAPPGGKSPFPQALVTRPRNSPSNLRGVSGKVLAENFVVIFGGPLGGGMADAAFQQRRR